MILFYIGVGIMLVTTVEAVLGTAGVWSRISHDLDTRLLHAAAVQGVVGFVLAIVGGLVIA